MKKTVIILSVLVLIASGCKQTTKQEQTAEKTNTEVITKEEQSVPDVPPIIQFDWTEMVALKNSTIEQLQKKAKSEDKIIMDFLENTYGKLIEKYNRKLSKDKNFNFIRENINNNSSENIDPRILSFIYDAKVNGMGLYYGHVDEEVFLSVSSDFIKSATLPYVNPVSAEFINLYCYAIDNDDSHEGICMASTAEAIERVYQWGELSKKVDVLEYKEHVEGSFSFYLHYLFFGGEYAPAWNWDDDIQKYDKYAIESMNEIIKKYPASRAALEFKAFLELLKEENFKRTENVEAYRKMIDIGNHTSTIFKDSRDGKRYKTVKIGKQTWMAMNLDYAAEGSVCYENKEENCAQYGRLYDWESAKKACPAGFHLPTDDEWMTLVKFVGGESKAGKKLKSKTGWDENGNGTDDYGFSALPGGHGKSDGNFNGVGDNGNWWSSSDFSSSAYYYSMACNYEYIYRDGHDKERLFSVRCVQDN